MIKPETNTMPVRMDNAARVNLLVLLFSGAAVVGIIVGGMFVDSWVGLIACAAFAEWSTVFIIGATYVLRRRREAKHG